MSKSRIVSGRDRTTASAVSHVAPPSADAATETVYRDERSVEIHPTYAASPRAHTVGRRFCVPLALRWISGVQVIPPSGEVRRNTCRPVGSRLSAHTMYTTPRLSTPTDGWYVAAVPGPWSIATPGPQETPLSGERANQTSSAPAPDVCQTAYALPFALPPETSTAMSGS